MASIFWWFLSTRVSLFVHLWLVLAWLSAALEESNIPLQDFPSAETLHRGSGVLIGSCWPQVNWLYVGCTCCARRFAGSRYLERMTGWNDWYFQLEDKLFVTYDCINILIIVLNFDSCWFWFMQSSMIQLQLTRFNYVSFRHPGRHYFASLEMSSLWDCELESGMP